MTGETGNSLNSYKIKPLIFIVLASTGIVWAIWFLSPFVSIESPLISYGIAFGAVTFLTLVSASVSPVLKLKGLLVVLLPSIAILALLSIYSEHVPTLLAALTVTATLLFAGTVVGGGVGGRIEHPGHLLAVVIASVFVDTLSVFHSAGPTRAVIERPDIIAVLALPWPIFGTQTFAPVLGVGDIVFAALYMSASRKFDLGRLRTAIALAIGLFATMAGVIIFQTSLPALVGMGIAVLVAHKKAWQIPRKDRKKAVILLGTFLVVWALLWWIN